MATTINAGRVRFVSRGTYNNSTQYYLFDLVDYNGSSYIAKENSLGNLPTNTQYWQLIAAKGDTYDDTELKNDISSINTNIKANYYNKADTDTKLDTKANTSDVYNKTETDEKLESKQDKLTAGTNITISDNTISVKDTYSTSEIKIGTFDGKALYRRCYIGTPTLRNDKWVYLDISSWGIGSIINLHGMAKTSGLFAVQPIPRVVPDSIKGYGIGFGDMDNKRIGILFGTNYTSINKLILVIEYTKDVIL